MGLQSIKWFSLNAVVVSFGLSGCAALEGMRETVVDEPSGTPRPAESVAAAPAKPVEPSAPPAEAVIVPSQAVAVTPEPARSAASEAPTAVDAEPAPAEAEAAEAAPAEEAEEEQPPAAPAQRLGTPPPIKGSPAADVKQKISYAGVLLMSHSAKRIEQSDNAQAKALLEETKNLLGRSRVAIEGGDAQSAGELVDQALQQFGKATRMVPSEDLLTAQKKRYEELRVELDRFKTTHRQSHDKITAMKGAAAAVDYDQHAVERLAAEAEQLAAQQHYETAQQRLLAAQREVNHATKAMLDNMTLVHKLKLDTPADEYDYELKRYHGYEELITVAIEVKAPPPNTVMLINRAADKGRGMAEQAKQKAAEKDYPVAIRMMQDATDEIRRALRFAGVDQ